MSRIAAEIINRGLEDRLTKGEQDTLTKEFSKMSALTGSFSGVLRGGGGGGGTIGDALFAGWQIDIDGIHSDDRQVHLVSYPNPYFSLGADDYGSGSGVWMGQVSDEYVFYVGSDDGDAMVWDGTDLNITGDIIADGGTIGGISIGADYLQSSNYASGVSGFHLNDSGYAEFGDVRIRGTLASAVFEVNQIHTTGGTLAVTEKVSSLGQAIAFGSDTYIYINNDASVSARYDTCSFNVGDIIRIKALASGDGTPKDTWATLSGTKTDMGDGTHRFEFTNKQGNTGAGYPIGVAVVGYSSSGGGVVYISADDAVGASANMSIVQHTSTPWNDDTDGAPLRVRIGNMYGSYGTGSNNRHGFGVGDYSGENYLSYNAEVADSFILKAGDGAVTMDEGGIVVDVGGALLDNTAYQLRYSGTIMGGYSGWVTSTLNQTWTYAKPMTGRQSSHYTDVRSPSGQYATVRFQTLSGGKQCFAGIMSHDTNDEAYFSVTHGAYFGDSGMTAGREYDGHDYGGYVGIQNHLHVGTGLIVGNTSDAEVGTGIIKATDYIRANGGLTTDSTNPGTGNLYIAGTGRIVNDVAISGALNVGRITTQGTNGWIYSYGAEQGWIASHVAGDYSVRWYAGEVDRWFTPDAVAIAGGLYVGQNAAPGADDIYADGDIQCLAGMMIGGTTHSTKCSRGLTINQATYDDEVLALQSSDIAHGMTSVADTDTFGQIRKLSGSEGGYYFAGYSEGNRGAYIRANCVSGSSARNNSATAGVVLSASLRDGSGPNIKNWGTNINLVAINNHGYTIFLFDSSGNAHADTDFIDDVWDEYEDAELVRALDKQRLKSKKNVIENEFDQYIRYNREALEETGLITINDHEGGDGSTFINYSGLTRLHSGAIWQLHTKIMRIVKALDKLGIISEKELLAA